MKVQKSPAPSRRAGKTSENRPRRLPEPDFSTFNASAADRGPDFSAFIAPTSAADGIFLRSPPRQPLQTRFFYVQRIDGALQRRFFRVQRVGSGCRRVFSTLNAPTAGRGRDFSAFIPSAATGEPIVVRWTRRRQPPAHFLFVGGVRGGRSATKRKKYPLRGRGVRRGSCPAQCRGWN